jgi:molybdopterin-guanine dinucleotide biosynthesis protein A
MGSDKAFALLDDKPLLAHVVARLAPQVGILAISAHEEGGRHAELGLPVVLDRSAGRQGPLAGLAAGLRFARSHGASAMAVAPTDAPFLPFDLVSRLEQARPAEGVAVAAGPNGLEPLFSLWPVSALEAVESALAGQRLSVVRLLAGLDHRLVRFEPGEAAALRNLNSAADLDEARAGRRR